MTLELMLKRSKKRRTSRSPNVSREPHRPAINVSHISTASHSTSAPTQHYGRTSEMYPAAYDAYPSQMHGHHGYNTHIMHTPINSMPHHHVGQLPHTNFPEAEQFLRGLDQTEVAQLPVWLSDQSLGGQSFSQHGMDAFIIPPDLFPPTTQIW